MFRLKIDHIWCLIATFTFWMLKTGNTLGEIAGEKAGIFKVFSEAFDAGYSFMSNTTYTMLLFF